MKVLNVIRTAYRGTLEEQDDTIVWITHAMKGAGAELDVLLRGSAVNYAAKAQEVSPMSFGQRTQKNAPRLARDVSALIDKGVAVYIVDEDLAERGIADNDLIAGVARIKRAEMPKLFDGYDHVWAW
jgi:sulfur relay (sulfurtransferase) DsrF/TusC family protein